MDETMRAPRPTGTDDVVERQQALPFDAAADEPIAFRLTARARREIAPDALPDLRVVDGDLDDPGDTRASRARALRRAGMSLHDIADRLGVDELLVQAWTNGVSARRPSRRRMIARQPVPATVGAPAVAAVPAADAAADGVAAARSAARDEAVVKLATDPDFAAGLGLLAGLAVIDEHAVTITTSNPTVAARLWTWLQTHAGVARPPRVVLRIGPTAAGDLARHHWADVLGVAAEEVTHTRWRAAPTLDAEEALIRLPDPALAVRIAGWRDVLLGRTTPPSDRDF